MKKWKDWSSQEKCMVVIILLLLIGIITRWEYVKKGITDSFSDHSRTETTTPAN